MTPNPDRSDRSADPVVRVLGGYLASVAAAVATFAAIDVFGQTIAPPAPAPTEMIAPGDGSLVVISLLGMLLVVGVFAFPPFLLCLAISVRARLTHPAFHVACGSATGVGLWRLFDADRLDRTIPAADAGAVGGAVYWTLAVRKGRVRPP